MPQSPRGGAEAPTRLSEDLKSIPSHVKNVLSMLSLQQLQVAVGQLLLLYSSFAVAIF
jgi:hypothetical protein